MFHGNRTIVNCSIIGESFGGNLGKDEGNYGKKNTNLTNMPSQNGIFGKFHPNLTMGKCSKIGGREGISKKKMQTSQMPSKNESMQEVPSKSDDGKVFKIREKI